MDVDFDTYSVSKFLRLVEKGQPIAVEMLFAEPVDNLMTKSWVKVRSAGFHLLNSKLSGMFGLSQSLDKAKFSDTGVQKKLYHAVRVNLQIKELCDTGNLTFPLMGANFLKTLKDDSKWSEEAFVRSQITHEVTLLRAEEARESAKMLPVTPKSTADEEILKIHKLILGIS